MIARPFDLVVGKWGARYRGEFLPCSIGRSGIGVKRGEGDGITPVGEFQIMGSGHRRDRVDFAPDAFQTRAIGPRDIWSDDPKDPNYNHGLSAVNYRYSHECLRRADPLYDIFAVLDFNYPHATPGAGSAIFIHNWRKPRHPTEGCVAFDPRDLIWILESWQPDARVIIRG